MGKYSAHRRKDQWGLTKVDDLLESIDIKPIAFKSPEGREKYRKTIEAVCMQALDGAKDLNIQEFCRENDINPATFYYYMHMPQTKEIISKFLDRVTEAAKPQMFRKLKEVYNNKPGFAALYHRRYEKWIPEEKHTGTITVTFPFLEKANMRSLSKGKSDKSHDKSTEDAEYTELTDDASDSK